MDSGLVGIARNRTVWLKPKAERPHSTTTSGQESSTCWSSKTVKKKKDELNHKMATTPDCEE